MKNAKSQSHKILHKPLPSNEAESWRPAGKARCKWKVQMIEKNASHRSPPCNDTNSLGSDRSCGTKWLLAGAVRRLGFSTGAVTQPGSASAGKPCWLPAWGLSLITGFGVLGFQIYTDFRARFGPSGVDVALYGLVHSSKKTIDKTEKEDFTKAKNFYKEAVWMM